MMPAGETISRRTFETVIERGIEILPINFSECEQQIISELRLLGKHTNQPQSTPVTSRTTNFV
jgi:hypothetical protein